MSTPMPENFVSSAGHGHIRVSAFNGRTNVVESMGRIAAALA